MNAIVLHRRKAFRATPGGEDTVFDETWSSCTPGTYTSEPITGSDETWDLDDITGGGVTVPNPASDYVTLDGSSDDWYMKATIPLVAGSYEEFWLEWEIPSTNGGYVSLYLYNADASETVTQIDINDEDEIYVNHSGGSDLVDSTAGADTRFWIKLTVNHSADTFDYDINGVTDTGLGFVSSSGTGGNMTRFEMYVSSNANNLKKLGQVKAGASLTE